MEKELPIGLRFSLLHRAFRRKMNELLKEQDMTGVQFGVLGALDRLEQETAGEIYQRDLENHLHMSHATMTEIVRRLEKKELIRCETSARDRRYKAIASTEKAHALRREVDQVEEDTFRWLCRGLSPQQVEALLTAMDAMLQNAMEGSDCGSD